MRGANSNLSSSHTPLLEGTRHNASVLIPSKSIKLLSFFLSLLLLLLLALAMVLTNPGTRSDKSATVIEIGGTGTLPRGVSEGVSGKSVRTFRTAYPWTNAMLAWQRTSYHFQPEKNWMNGTHCSDFLLFPTFAIYPLLLLFTVIQVGKFV